MHRPLTSVRVGLGVLLLLSITHAAVPPFRAQRNCATCHPAQAKPHPETSMAHAMETVGECTILKAHPLLTFAAGKYSYRIERAGNQSIYSVTDGQQTITVPIGWAFGLGSAGQTYVFQKDGEFYESRVSFYNDLNGLDLTMGATNSAPANLLEAAGRFMGRDEKARCFGCHATNATEGTSLALQNMIPGIQCERCHGSIQNHLAGIKSGNAKLAQMTHLKAQTTEEISTFCGQCHRTWADVAGGGTLGISNLRFQPYRLTNSKCYDPDDPRISCLACHDPHSEVVNQVSSYDAKCNACHAGGKPGAHICKVATHDCASCHMPKLDLPGSHHQFTDHDIRIVRVNSPYPN